MPAPPARQHDEVARRDPRALDTGEPPLALTPVGLLGSAVSAGGAEQGITSQGRSSRPTGRGTTKSVEAGREDCGIARGPTPATGIVSWHLSQRRNLSNDEKVLLRNGVV